MPESRRFRIRVVYSISFRLAMLSHLELARTLERIVRRAKLPFAVSNGFSPHMKIAFGSALPVGVGGDQEIFDLQLLNYIAPDKVLKALKDASAPGILINECKYIENGEVAASVAYPISVYEVEFDRSVSNLMIPETVEVIRKKKQKVIQVSDHLLGDLEFDQNKASFSLVSLPTGSLRPDVFINACLNASSGIVEGIDGIKVCKITRIAQNRYREIA